MRGQAETKTSLEAPAACRNRFLEQLAEAWRPHAAVRGKVVVAVSGGGDSLALLHGLATTVLPALGRSASQLLVVAHACHDLRPAEQAKADEDFVRGFAEARRLHFVSTDLEVRATVGGGEGLEAAARRLRYAFFTSVAESHGARLVATAHSLDDQVETVLHRLLRGTGLGGLAGMSSARELREGIALVRPMLAITAATARGYLRACGQEWREDESNGDTLIARNLLRKKILPRLVDGPYPAAAEAILRVARQASGVADTLAAAAGAVLDAHGCADRCGGTILRTQPLVSLDRRLLEEIAVELWRRHGWPRRAMTARHYASVADLLVVSVPMCDRERSASTIDFPGGVRATVESAGCVRIGPVDVSPRPAPPSRR